MVDQGLQAMAISAAVWDLAVRDSWVGHVHSVFDRAANVVVDGALLTIVAEGAGAPPNGIVLETSASLRHLDLAAGLPVRVVAGHWQFSTTGSLDTTRARSWSPWLLRRAVPGPGVVAGNLAALRAAIIAQAGPERLRHGFGPLILWRSHDLVASTAISQETTLARRAAGAVSRASGALVAGDVARAAEAARGLVGLGPGLTPSGDDFIVGLTAALFALGHESAREFAAECAAAAQEGSTAVSRAYLSWAARGAFAQVVHELIDGLLGERPLAVGVQARSLLGWGATSGMDLFAGVTAGFEVVRDTTRRSGTRATQRRESLQ